MGTLVSYVPAPTLLGTEEKSKIGPTSGEQKISRQIDTLERLAKFEQSQRWGDNWSSEMLDFFNLQYYPVAAAPSYRPKVILPELQFLLMSEATELTNDSPKTYISVNGKRDEQREKAFSAQWKSGMYNMRIFEAVLWSQFCNPGCLQLGFNPLARNGKGVVWLRARDVDSFFPDANCKNDTDWSYVVAEDWFYIDEIKRMWGDRASGIRSHGEYEDYTEDQTTGSNFDLSLELPPGPLRVDSPEGFEHQRKGPRERVRYLFVKDYARERVTEIAGRETAEGLELVTQPLMKWKYPGGRFIAECQGFTLADGPNYVPRLPDDDFSTFPFVGVWSLPHPKHYFGAPPVRYGKGPQDIAERMYTQLIENLIRLNNGQAWIPEESGIDIDAYGGLPGEVQVYRGDKPPTITWPAPIPQHMTQVPELLLQKVARYIGWTPERQGQVSPGNISPELFDASVFQSQSMLRMKARLLSETYQRVALMAFHMMCKYKRFTDQIRPARTEKQQPAVWTPLPEEAEVDMELDETSVDSLSSTMMKQLAVALGKTGQVPSKYVLETLGVPNSAEIADEATRQLELSAIAKLKRPR
jgi:hypothetical protein